MKPAEYNAQIESLSNAAYIDGWRNAATNARTYAAIFRAADPEMTMVLQGLAVQADRLIANIEKRKASIDRAASIIKNAEPIEDTTEIKV